MISLLLASHQDSIWIPLPYHVYHLPEKLIPFYFVVLIM
jgi:hypothetical protein